MNTTLKKSLLAATVLALLASGGWYWNAARKLRTTDNAYVNAAIVQVASPDPISWVLTSYLIASAVFMPLTGFFTDRFGRKQYLLVSIAGFVIASALCGLANGLPEMVLFRLFQGVFGAALVPLSQAVMGTPIPLKRAARPWQSGAWGWAAPILGPSLGGYLTEIASWRWPLPAGNWCWIAAPAMTGSIPVSLL